MADPLPSQSNENHAGPWTALRNTIGVLSGIVATILLLADYKVLALFLYLVLVLIGVYDLTIVLVRSFPEKKQEFDIGLLSSLVFLLLFFAFFRSKLIPEPKPKPALNFYFRMSEANHRIGLTNDFFRIKVFNAPESFIRGFLLVPVSIDSNSIALSFTVINDSPITSESISVTMTAPDDLGIKAEGWTITESGSAMSGYDPSGKIGNYKCISRSFGIPLLHPGDGFEMPAVIVGKMPLPGRPMPLALFTRAKEVAPSGVRFCVSFVPTNGPGVPRKMSQLANPLVIFARTNDTTAFFTEDDFP